MNRLYIKKFYALPIIFFIGIYCLANNLIDKDTFYSGVAEAAQENKSQEKKPIRIGFIPQVNAVHLVKQWQPFLDYLATELDMPVEMVIKSDYRSVIAGLSKSEMDVALLGSFAYIQAYSQLDIEPLAKRVIFGSPDYHSIIVVRKDKNIVSFSKLKGRTFAFTDKNSTTGYLLPKKMMLEKGFGKPENFFSQVIYTGNHDSALLAVYNKSVDGAGISTTRWNPNNPKIRDLKVLWKSSPIPLGPFVVRKDMPRSLVTKIRNAFLKLGKTPETKELAKHMEIDGFLTVSDKEYDVVRKIQKAYKIKSSGE
jgi:phosphonate transport system substrate-binding protein